MGVYHITYSSRLGEICFFFDHRCNFNCRGCITRAVPADYHLREPEKQKRRESISVDKALDIIEGHPFKRAVHLGFEPTADPDFLLLAHSIKKRCPAANVLITNGYNYVEDDILDEVCVSVKAVSEDLFEDFTGRKNSGQVLENLALYTKKPDCRARAESILIPNYIDMEEIEKIAASIAGVDKNIPYRIDAYIPTKEPSGNIKSHEFRAPTADEMSAAKKIAERHLSRVSILHGGMKGLSDVERLY